MMVQYLYVLTLLVALCTSTGGAEKCTAARATSFTFSVASRRNLTGHWIVSVEAAMEDGREASPQRDIAVQVSQRAVFCNDTSNTLLTGTAILNVLAATDIATVNLATPPDGYEMMNGLGYYKMHTTALTWEEAKNKCVQEGAHLMIINSDQEAEVFKTYFARKPKIESATSENFGYLGFHDRDTEGKYVTILGESLASSGYMRWTSGEPDEAKGRDCGGAKKDAELVILDCTWRYFFICECNGS